MDVSYAFQSTPAPIIEGNCYWLPFLHSILCGQRNSTLIYGSKSTRKHKANLLTHLLLAEMFEMVQGGVDPSHKWQELIEKIMVHADHGQCLESNWADPCFYTAGMCTIDGSPVLLSRGTNDLLVSTSQTFVCKDPCNHEQGG